MKNGRKTPTDIMGRIFQLEEMCKQSFEDTWLPKEPDIEKIEEFLYWSYTSQE